jgi:ABC-type amino acid transport substrate-binding protein
MNLDVIVKIGNTVKIINWGQLYSTYQAAATYMKLKKFKQGYNGPDRRGKDIIYTVVNTYQSGQILAITDGIVDLIIGRTGVTLTERLPLIPEKAKGPQLFDADNLYPYTK